MMSLLSIKINFLKTIKILNIFQYILTHLIISSQIQYNEQDFFQIWHLFDCRDFVGQEKLYRCTLTRFNYAQMKQYMLALTKYYGWERNWNFTIQFFKRKISLPLAEHISWTWCLQHHFPLVHCIVYAFRCFPTKARVHEWSDGSHHTASAPSGVYVAMTMI